MSESTLLRKEPCPACGSRDNLARYTDGHAYCFGCQHYEAGDDSDRTPTRRNPRMAEGLLEGEFKALGKRGISEETCRKFGYMVGEKDGQPIQIAPYFNADGEMTGQKIRWPNKDFKVFGKLKEAGLFGQNLWGSGGKKIVVTEGEIDAMSVSQLQGNKWPVVSIPNGAQAGAKDVAKQLEWLNTFESVIFMFDMDEPGRAAAVECAKLLKPGKAHIASLPLKDANECLTKGKGEAVVNAIWQAKPYRPDGVVKLSDLMEEIMTPPTMGLSWWSDELTAHTFGRRYGEVYTFGAGTGIGKTDFLTQQIQHDVDVLGERVGLFMLEQKPAETAKRVAGKFAGKAFHVPDGSWTPDELREVIERLEKDDRLFFYDSFGTAEWETIESTIRYLVHSEGIRIFYVDHLTALADPDDEKTSIEKAMKAIAMLAAELGIIIHLVSHLATPDGTPHEEGGRVTIRHFKGSRSIGFWSHFMFGLERNQQHEEESLRSITTFRILKDRNTGRSTGKLVYFGYDSAAGKLFATAAPENLERAGFSDTTLNDDL